MYVHPVNKLRQHAFLVTKMNYYKIEPKKKKRNWRKENKEKKERKEEDGGRRWVG